MIKQTIVALALLCIAINTTAQVLTNATSRYYLPTSSQFSQAQIDSFNLLAGYQFDIANGEALTYPDLAPISLVWNGTTWVSNAPVAITSAFSTPLMVGSISHTATTTAGALAPNVVFDWADVQGVTQYRFRIRPVGGTWNASTITGSQRALNTLAYNTTYEVQVRVYLSATTQGEYTQTYTFTTPNFVPLPSCNSPIVTATATTDSITLSWASVGQGIAYQVQVRELGSLVWGGTTTTANTYKFPSTGKAYEYQVRTNCTGASATWSAFTQTDTATSAVCTAPTSFSATGKTFNWIDHEYGNLHQVQIRRVGTANWGGTTTATNSVTFNSLTAGTYEWRVRSKCYATTNTGWTSFSPSQYHTIVATMMFEPIEITSAYPNPANDVVYLPGEIVLRDLTGRVIATGTDILDVSQYADGLYFINGKKHIIKH